MRMPARSGAIVLPLLLAASAAFAQAPKPDPVAAKLDEAHAAMVVDPNRVVALVGEARQRIAKEPPNPATALASVRAAWLEAEARGRLGDTARAEEIANAALVEAERLAGGSKLHGDILMTQGGLALDQNKMQRAFQLFERAYKLFLANGETRAQAIALQNIGTIYSYAGDQRRVLRYYAQAHDAHPNDDGLAQTAANNLGNAYKELGEFDRAAAEYERALALARKMESPLLEARGLTNLASLALLRGRLADAERFADRGIRVARAGDADEWLPFLWGVKGQIAQRRGQMQAALALFGRTFADEDLEKTSFYFRDFHESASIAYRAAGDAGMALRHLMAFKRLDDEAREIRSSTNAALAAAQFDYSNQELRISRLSEANLRTRARQQTLIIIGSLLLLAVSLVALFWIRRSRNETRAANRQLATTNTALDKALKAKSEFLATTSHEIRTPLNGILGMTQVMMGQSGMDGAVRDQLRLIDSAGNTMKAIVDDILDMAQIEQGRVQVDRGEIALPALIESVAGLWRASAEHKGLAFTVDTTDAPAHVVEDERKLRQIIFNLLSNAVKFTLSGSIRIIARTETDADGERLLILVEDTGIGIAADQISAIFEPFRQADGGTTRQFGGTGLGLAISSKLAAALDGGISASSEPDVGSRFTLSLPLVRAAAPVGLPASRPEQLAGASVVVLEGNPLFASMIDACIEEAVRSVTVADTDADPLPAADIYILGEDVTAADIARLRAVAPSALLVMLGEAGELGAQADAVVERAMPPLHLASELEALFAAAGAGDERKAA